MVTDSRKYIWVLPIIGGVLVLISFFTPAVSYNDLGIQEQYWMWGLYYQSISGYGSRLTFIPTQEPSQFMLPLFLIGIFPAILILSGSIKLITSGNAIRTGRKSIKNLKNLWIGLGIMLIIAPIIYIIGIDIIVTNYLKYILEEIYGFIPPIPNFWNVYNPGFALIASFIGAIFSIVGGIASKTIKTKEEPIFIGEKKEVISKRPIGENSTRFNFCPECGHQLLYIGNKFCTECGTDFNKL